MNLAKKITALNIPFVHEHPRASRVCLALRNCHGFPLCRFAEKRGLEWPAIPSLPPALGKYSGQAVANTLLTVVSP